MKNVKFASISDQLINTAIIMLMMFNTEMIVKVLKGGKEDMTEKRFTVHINWFNYDKTEGEITLKDNGQPLLESECIEDVQRVKVLLNELNDENEHYKSIFFELVETALRDKNCRELYCKGILDMFDKANSLNQAREMIKEHLE